MSLKKCPKCDSNSLITVPHCQIHTNNIHTSDVYSFDCLNRKCNYKSGEFEMNTTKGDLLRLPFFRRIFNLEWLRD